MWLASFSPGRILCNSNCLTVTNATGTGWNGLIGRENGVSKVIKKWPAGFAPLVQSSPIGSLRPYPAHMLSIISWILLKLGSRSRSTSPIYMRTLKRTMDPRFLLWSCWWHIYIFFGTRERFSVIFTSIVSDKWKLNEIKALKTVCRPSV